MQGVSVRSRRSISGFAFVLQVLSMPAMAAAMPASPCSLTAGQVSPSEVTDRLAISEVLNAFSYLYDTEQWDEFAILLAPDATFDAFLPAGSGSSFSGRESIIAALKKVRLSNNSLKEQPHHIMSGIVFRCLTDDSATTVSYLDLSFSHSDRSTERRALQTFVSDFRKLDGRWRLSALRLYVGSRMPPVT